MNNSYEVLGETTILFCTYRGETVKVLIDTKDLPLIDSYEGTWYCNYSRKPYVRGNIRIDGKRTSLKLHRFIMNPKEGHVVDHKNNDTFDNRRSNLRCITEPQNRQNRSLCSLNTSGFRGISWNDKYKRWVVQVKHNGKHAFFKRYKSLIVARVAVRLARKKYLPYSTN